MPDAKLERLLNLTAALLDTARPLTADEIQRRVSGYPDDNASFKRQFERDKDALREMGIPLRMEDVHSGEVPVAGYRIAPGDYYLPEIDLSADELAALHLAVRAVRLDGAAVAEGLWKLGGVVDSGAPQAVEAEPVASVTLPTDPNLTALFGACTQRSVVKLETGGTIREVEPHRLRFRRGRWYLVGFDRLRSEVRSYRVDRIRGLVEVLGGGGAFTIPPAADPSLDPWLLHDDPPVTARVALDKSVAPSALLGLNGERVVERLSDGSVVIEVEVTNPDGFRSYVLGFLDHAEVLSPPELRDSMIEWLRACAECT